MDGGTWWAAVCGVAESQTRLSNFTFTFHFHAVEKEMAPHSSVLDWRIPGTGEPGGLPSMGSHRVGHDWSDLAAAAAIAAAQLTAEISLLPCYKDFSGGSDGKAPAYNVGDPSSIPGSGERKISWRRKWQPTPVFLPGKSHGRRNLVGYSPRGHKESDMTEQLQFML